MKWIHGEAGPTCFCGLPTVVCLDKDGTQANLLCIAHTSEFGAMFPLPMNQKPDTWPEVDADTMANLVDAGFVEQDKVEGTKSIIDIPQQDKMLN